MKLSDYVAQFLARHVGHVFAISGSASLHLIHSVAEAKGIEFVCPQHEQNAAFAADAYARLNGLGVAIATSGPGATNLLTGVAAAWADSVPVMYITGQVVTNRMKGGLGVRSLGFQETDIVAMARPVTKYAVQVTDPKQIRFELEKAVAIAQDGRPGPVLIDLPDDIQRAEIADPEALPAYWPAVGAEPAPLACLPLLLASLHRAQRPVLILGAGVRMAGAVPAVHALIERLQIPVALTWGAIDQVDHRHPLVVGGFGTHGTRAANLVVQNADLVISLGARLDTKATGTPTASFAREATVWMIDLDPAEISKMAVLGREVVGVQGDARSAAEQLLGALEHAPLPAPIGWLARVASWKARYPAVPDRAALDISINPYHFVRALEARLRPDDILVADTGFTICWLMQAFRFTGQRMLHAFGTTPMGYGLAAAIGACFASGGQRRVVLVSGDGSFQMSAAELATVARHRLPIKILLLNNGGHAMCRQTQRRWLGGKFYATSVEGGLGFPDFGALAEAHGIPDLSVSLTDELGVALSGALAGSGPALLEVKIDPEHGLAHQVSFGMPNEDGEPRLPREEFLANMLVRPMAVSA